MMKYMKWNLVLINTILVLNYTNTILEIPTGLVFSIRRKIDVKQGIQDM